MGGTQSTNYASLEDALRGEQATWGVPGITVGILQNGKQRFYASGSLNVVTGTPIATGSILQIGSISKVFLATMIMRLVEAGKVTLDEPLATFLPDLKLIDPTLPSRLTLRHMLNHMSGILGDHFPDEGRGDDALAVSISKLGELPQIIEPDVAWSYCNLGFMIAGRVAEVVTGKTFEQLMQDEVFGPLKLDPITYFPDEAILHSAAAGHQAGNNGQMEIARPYAISRCSNPAGGIVTSTENLLRFAAFHIGDGTVDGEQVLSEESLREMQAVQATVNDRQQWGIGWALSSIDGIKTIGHGGATNGQQALLTIVPEKGYAIAVLTNSNKGSYAAAAITKWAIAHDLGLVQPEPEQITLADSQLARFAGEYRQPLASISIVTSETGLTATVTPHNPFTNEPGEATDYHLAPISCCSFVVTDEAGKGNRADFLDGASMEEPPAFVRFGSRLSRREQ